MAIPFLPGITAAQKEVGGTEDITLTSENAGPYLLDLVKALASLGAFDPYCGICKAKIETFHCAVGVTRFTSIDEAEPYLRASQEAQRRSAEFLKSGRN